ncbi:MAG: hypothetical protein U0457_21545 [Candidatus Sericytochromatia bacterium]
MKKLYSLLLVSLFTTVLGACNTQQNNLPDLKIDQSVINSKTPDIITNQDDIHILIKLDSTPFLSQATGELSAVALNDDGRIYKYQTIKNGNTVQATTFLYKTKWNLLESHPTTALEAQTILRLVSQGGFAKEYKEIQARYEQLDLVGLKK